MARRGENIHKRKDGRWEGRYIKARTPDRRICWGYIYGTTYAEVKQRLIHKKSEYGGFQLIDAHLTFTELAEAWLQSVKCGLKESTYAHYPKVLELVGINADEVGKIDANGKPVKVDLDRQLLKPLAGTGKMFCYDSPEYVKDMGTPERYYSVCKDCKEGKISAKNLKNKQKAIFLDRDGTINKYVGFLRNIDDFELIDGVAEAIRKINESGYLAIVTTNQPVIARGEVSFEELEEIHNKMETLLGKEGAYLDAIYYCPHHPHKGYEGERPELKIECDCRKPKPGMLLNAAADFNIDLSQSWMVGDGENDVKAGLNAGCKTALIGQDKENIGQLVSEISLLGFVKNNLQ